MLSEDPLATERSTPTCVGTIRRAGLIGKTSSVHPHVRGDDASDGAGARLDTGPPPRAWGRC